MCVKAIRLDKAEELRFRILDLMFPDERRSTRVNFVEMAKQLNDLAKQRNTSKKEKPISEEVVRYNVKKLVDLEYIRIQDDRYEPTEKVIFLKKKSG